MLLTEPTGNPEDSAVTVLPITDKLARQATPPTSHKAQANRQFLV